MGCARACVGEMSHGGRGWVRLYREALGGGEREKKKEKKMLAVAASVFAGVVESNFFAELLSWCCFSPTLDTCCLPLFYLFIFHIQFIY